MTTDGEHQRALILAHMKQRRGQEQTWPRRNYWAEFKDWLFRHE